MYYFQSIRRFFKFMNIDQISYLKQYETRDFNSKLKKINNNITNYYQTNEFKDFKPNLKSTYKK
jgi:hypothetical protein